MYKLKIFNNIADNGLHILHESNFVVTNDNPDAIMLRSEILKSASLNSEIFIFSVQDVRNKTIKIKLDPIKDLPNREALESVHLLNESELQHDVMGETILEDKLLSIYDKVKNQITDEGFVFGFPISFN